MIAIIGAGVGGLTLALALHQRGIACTVYEAAAELRPMGVGINILPHATRELAALGVLEALEARAVPTEQAAYFNRFGQLIHVEPLGRFAGYATPQRSIHRGTLQMGLLAEVQARMPGVVQCGRRAVSVATEGDQACITFADGEVVRADAAIAADGIHSPVRKQWFPDEGPPLYSGVNMWRGTTRMAPILGRPTMVRAGWLTQGKMVIYPIENLPDGQVLMNWVAEIETTTWAPNDWARPGKLEDFLPAFADWHFDWLDVPAMIRAADQVLEYPMVDRDPLPRWTHGRATLLGDAAHPMYPRGSNGAGQAILDARALADALAADNVPAALAGYDANRRPATAAVVRANRATPPDVIIKEVWERSGDKPFARIEDVISPGELTAMIDRYKTVAQYDRARVG